MSHLLLLLPPLGITTVDDLPLSHSVLSILFCHKSPLHILLQCIHEPSLIFSFLGRSIFNLSFVQYIHYPSSVNAQAMLSLPLKPLAPKTLNLSSVHIYNLVNSGHFQHQSKILQLSPNCFLLSRLNCWKSSFCNLAAWVLRDHVSPPLASLQWIPVNSWIYPTFILKRPHCTI